MNLKDIKIWKGEPFIFIDDIATQKCSLELMLYLLIKELKGDEK